MRRLWHKHKVVRVHEPLPEGVLYRESHHMPRLFSWPASIFAGFTVAAWTSAPSSFDDDPSIVWVYGALTALALLCLTELFAIWVEVRPDRIRFGIRPFAWHSIRVAALASWRVSCVTRVASFTRFGGQKNYQLAVLELHTNDGTVETLEGVRPWAVGYALDQARSLGQQQPQPAEVTA